MAGDRGLQRNPSGLCIHNWMNRIVYLLDRMSEALLTKGIIPLPRIEASRWPFCI